MIEKDNNKKSITQYSIEIKNDGLSELPKPTTKIVWKGCHNATNISEKRLMDPFITAHVKYFNSRFFRESCSDPRIYKRAIESIITILDNNNLQQTPRNIFGHLLAYLKKNFSSEYTIYKVYTFARTVSLRFCMGDTNRGVKKNRHLLNLIEYNFEEVKILRETNSQAPKVNAPESKSSPDLVSKFGFECNGEELLKSLRTFCIFYLNEWHNIRNYIYENHAQDVKELLSYSKNTERLLSSENNRNQIGESGRHLPNIAFDIIKQVNNPILNEFLSTSYLFAFSIGSCELNQASKIVQESYNHQTLTSTAKEIDWISQIDMQFKKKSTHRLATSSWAYKWIQRNKNLSLSKDFSIEPNWSGSLQSIPSIKDLLGITLCEEICMAWLLGSDRHQPSNLTNMIIEDLAETNNSVSTIISPFSYKARNMTSSGTSYSSPAGERYKRNTKTYEAISGYKLNLLRAYKMGILNDQDKSGNKYIFQMLRRPKYSDHSASFKSRFLTFSKNIFANYSIKLCAMNGSVSNAFVLENEPNSELFLKMIRHAYLLSPNEVNLNLSISINTVARQAVNNANFSNYSPTATPVSENNDLEITNTEALDKMELEAAKHNHSLKTKLEVYSNKLPPYLTKLANFSARVGDEIVNLALKMKDSSDILTLEELRETLGLSTTAEREQQVLNQGINEIMSHASLNDHIIDDTGFIISNTGKTIILRHPITIALIKGKINVIDKEIANLTNTNENLLYTVAAKRLFLMLMLDELFSPSEIRESDEKYANIEFPFSNIIV